jgi:hypothetical protein
VSDAEKGRKKREKGREVGSERTMKGGRKMNKTNLRTKNDEREEQE